MGDEELTQAQELAPEPLPNQVPNGLVRLIIQTYEDQQADMMGNLHNRFVAYISQSGVALAGTIVVLELLLDEARKLARERYVKG